MRRAPIVITATILGSAGVLLFKPLPISALSTSTAGSSSGSESSASSTPDSAASSGTGSSGTDSSGTADDSGATNSAKDGTYTGTAETIRYGTTQVKVTIAGGKITDVVVVEENQNDQRSVEISENAFPTLRQEVLAKQGADVDAVSGATYTSEQYEASLQSALDQANYSAPDGSKGSTAVSEVEDGLGRGH